LLDYAFAWSDSINYGVVASHWNSIALIPNGIFYFLLSHLNISNHISQIIFLQSVLLLTFLAIDALLSLFTQNNFILLMGVLFYIFNLVFQSSLFYTAKMFQLILIPLFFVCTYKYLETRHYKYAVYNFIAFFFLQAIFANPPQLLTTLLIYPIAILFFFIIKHNLKTILLKTNIIAIFKYFILLIPLFFYNDLIYITWIISTRIEGSTVVGSFTALQSPLSLIFQLRGAWWEYESFQEIPYNLWLFFYDNPLIILVSFGILVMALYFFLRKKVDLQYLFFLSMFLLFSIIACGLYFVPGLYLWALNSIPGFFMFREPWSKFMPLVLFFFTILFVLSLEALRRTCSPTKFSAIILIVLFLIVLKGIPFFSPDMFDHTQSGWDKKFINPPSYWYNFKSWSQDNSDKYILPTPYYVEPSLVNYQWYNTTLGNANIPLYYYFGDANLIAFNLGDENYFSNVIQTFTDQKNINFIKICSVDYLLEQKDINLSSIPDDLNYQNDIKSFFQDTPSITFDNKLNLYATKPEYYIPQVYASSKILIANQSITSLPTIVSANNYQKETVIVFNSTSKNLNELSEKIPNIQTFEPEPSSSDKLNFFDSKSTATLKMIIRDVKNNTGLFSSAQNDPIIEFKKINPTKYRVRIHNATQPFMLVISDAYNNNWAIYQADYQVSQNSPNLNYSYSVTSPGQANVSTVQQFINHGWISEISNSGNVNFISDNYDGSIQNNNLPDGPIYETWFEPQVSNNNHYRANGYLNSWLIDPTTLNAKKIQRNPNGSYDFELVIDYWPQSLFYLGEIASGTTLICCIGYLVYDWNRGRRKNKGENSK